MGGQPELPNFILGLDCTAIDVVEVGGIPPSNVIAVTSQIEFSAKFHGGGMVWMWLKGSSAPYEVQYAAESMGPGTNNVNLGAKTGNLTASNSYGAPETTLSVAPGTLSPGVYRLSCVVKFPSNPGLIGFFEGQVFEVY